MNKKTGILCKRIRTVLAEVYDGNKTLMSNATGNDRSTIAKYESGARTPTKRFMTSLSHATGISLDWLLGTGGDQIQYGNDAGSELARPVTTIPCERVPTTSTPGYNGLNRQTAPYHNERNKFWLKVQKDYAAQHVYAGDLILIREMFQSAAKDIDVDHLFIMKRNEKVVFEPVTEQDVKDGTVLFGKAIMCERDLEA